MLSRTVTFFINRDLQFLCAMVCVDRMSNWNGLPWPRVKLVSKVTILSLFFVVVDSAGEIVAAALVSSGGNSSTSSS